MVLQFQRADCTTATRQAAELSIALVLVGGGSSNDPPRLGIEANKRFCPSLVHSIGPIQ